MLCMWILYCFQTKWDSVVRGVWSQYIFSFLLELQREKWFMLFLEAELIYLTSVMLRGRWMEPLVLAEQCRVWSRAAGSSQRPAVTNLGFSHPINSPATSAGFFFFSVKLQVFVKVQQYVWGMALTPLRNNRSTFWSKYTSAKCPQILQREKRF